MMPSANSNTDHLYREPMHYAQLRTASKLLLHALCREHPRLVQHLTRKEGA